MALKVGVVGMGGIGNRHAACHAADDLADLVAVCDVVEASADRAAARHGVKAYYSLEDMVENEDLDIVDVTTGGNENGSWHCEPTMEALAAGKHVLCEKPLSNDIDEAREMVAYAAEQNRYLGCNLNHHFSQPADKAREYLAAGLVGEQIYCIHKMGFAGGEATYRPNKGPKSWGHPYFHVKAFLTHPFSVMREFCGDITHVQAFFDRPSFRKQAGDLMISLNSIHVRFESGAMGYLLSQRGDTTFGMGGWWSVEVGGTRGTFCIENCVEKITFWPAPGTVANPEDMSHGTAAGPVVDDSGIADFSSTFPNRIHAFLEDVTRGVPREDLRASGRDALAALEYTWAAIESYENGGVLVTPNPLPLLKRDPRA